MANKSERGLQSSPTVTTLCSASLALATRGTPEPGTLLAQKTVGFLLPNRLLAALVGLMLGIREKADTDLSLVRRSKGAEVPQHEVRS